MFIVTFCLQQAYLEDFYHFCEELGGATSEIMCEALAVCDVMTNLEMKTRML